MRRNKNYVILSDNETAIIRNKIEEDLYKTFKSRWSHYWFPLKDIKDNIGGIYNAINKRKSETFAFN